VEIAGESELISRNTLDAGPPLRLRFTWLLLLVAIGRASAQRATGDSLPRITAISVDRFSIFDRTDSSWLARFANSLHYTTRAGIIRQEFLFHQGERYDSAAVAETERNLRALGVFRDVAIDSVPSDSGVALQVVTRDGWTTRPDFRFHSTGGSVAYTAALIEDNLLGTVTSTELLYQKDPDRTTTVLGFHRNRLIAGKVLGAAQFANRSDGELFSAELALPYFANASPDGASIFLDDRRDRILQYRDGEAVASDTTQNRYLLVRADAGWALHATSRDYLRIGFAAQVRRDDYEPEQVYDQSGITTKSVTGAVGVYLEARHVNIPKVRGFQSFGRAEDVDLSTVIRLSLFAAPSFLGYDAGGLAPGIAAHVGARFGGGLAWADGVADGLYTARGLDSGQVSLGGTLALLPSARHEFVAHGEIAALRDPLPGTEFDLGLGAGPRAFTQHSFTGDREFFATAEYRYTISPELLKVIGVGVAAFADYGGAWWSDESQRTGWDYGVGLRLGASRAPDLESNRIDLAWRAARPGMPGGWVVAVGKGFVFSTGPRGTSR
jgi:hypothetical protein